VSNLFENMKLVAMLRLML